MDNAVMLDAPPTMFDELPTILAQSKYTLALISTDSVTRGIRRHDTACYSVTHKHAVVGVWAERRVGNPTISISVIPERKSIWHRDPASDKLAEMIIELLIVRGATNE